MRPLSFDPKTVVRRLPISFRLGRQPRFAHLHNTRALYRAATASPPSHPANAFSRETPGTVRAAQIRLQTQQFAPALPHLPSQKIRCLINSGYQGNAFSLPRLSPRKRLQNLSQLRSNFQDYRLRSFPPPPTLLLSLKLFDPTPSDSLIVRLRQSVGPALSGRLPLLFFFFVRVGNPP